MENPWDLLARASSPGDVATILLAGTVGFTLDAGLNVIGFLSPGYVGLTFASAALGAKKAWEASAANRVWRKRLLRRARDFHALLLPKSHLAQQVENEIEMLKKDIRTLDASEKALNHLIDQYK